MIKQGNPVRTLRQIAVSVFCSCHAVALIGSTLVPQSSALGQAIAPLVHDYLIVTGTRQTWSMFRSAPYYHRYQVELVATDTEGVEHTFGPILPGLRPYDEGHYRYHKVLGGLATPGRQRYLDAYLKRARDEIEATHDITVASTFLRYRTDRLRDVVRIRQDGQLSYSRTYTSRRRSWNP